jgi:hypothetical protein
MTDPKYCAHYPCSRVLVQRPQEIPSAFTARKYCSVACSNAGGDHNVPHGSLRGYKIHWLRNEKPCTPWIAEILKALEAGEHAKPVAARYSVSTATVSRIKNAERPTYVP